MKASASRRCCIRRQAGQNGSNGLDLSSGMTRHLVHSLGIVAALWQDRQRLAIGLVPEHRRIATVRLVWCTSWAGSPQTTHRDAPAATLHARDPIGVVQPLPWPGPLPIDGGEARRAPDRTLGSGRMRRSAPGTPAWRGLRHHRQTDRPLTACAVDQRAADPASGVEDDDRVPGLGVRVPQDLQPDPVEDPIRAVPVAEGDQRIGRRAGCLRGPASRLPAGPGSRADCLAANFRSTGSCPCRSPSACGCCRSSRAAAPRCLGWSKSTGYCGRGR